MRLPANIHSLIDKYNRPGPRYTSYPTAPHFSPETSDLDLIEECRSQMDSASLYVHIPFCESNCWFCGCNTIITTRRKSADQYLELLEKEVALINDQLPHKRTITQIHFGGGTPNFLSVEQIHHLFSILEEGFIISPDKEFSVEFAPNYLSETQLDAFLEHGLSRASFGVQDIQLEVQQAINRVQPQQTNIHTMQMLRDRGLASVNIDLIYGLPYQTLESYQKTLDSIFELNPDRLAVFNYAHVPHMKPYQKKLEQHPMPTPGAKVDLLLSIIQTLSDRGYHYVGMDHFAKAEDELHLAQREMRLHRNFQGYTVQEEKELIALGVSSISETPYSYRQNVKTLPEYQSLLDKGNWPIFRGLILSKEDFARRSMIQSVMCNLRLDYESFARSYPELFPSIQKNIQPKLPELEADGLIQIHASGFEVTDLGRLFLRNIAMIFDAYLGMGNARFSKTI